MKWHELIIKTTEEAYDAISEMLMSIGAGGVAIEDPNDIRTEISKAGSLDYADDEFLNSLGDDVTIKTYFPGNLNRSELTELVKGKLEFISGFLDIGEGYKGCSEVDEEDWATAWKKYYKPVHISEKIVIKPSWEEYEGKEDEIIIQLDPGMAFGTGTHETTRLCARMIEKYLNDGDSVIDLGCGTGILAIIAAKLGARRVSAVDIDEVAVRVAKENCLVNNVSQTIYASKGVLEDIKKEKVDLIVANIIANVIIDISESLPCYLKTGGVFITSGIIRERKQQVIDTYLSRGFELIAVQEDGEWVGIVFKCRGSL